MDVLNAPLTPEEWERYQRQLLLPQVGVEGQRKLRQSAVLVVGAGGLGLPVISYLAAAGVGRMVVMDGDRVEWSNLHRQVMFRSDDVGQSKAEVAAREAGRLNPLIRVEYINGFFDTLTGPAAVSGCTWLADCTDNFASRYQINDVCVHAGIPFVSGAVQGDELQVAVLNRNGGGTYRCLFPEPPSPEQAPPCQQAGILGTVAGMAGMLMAHELLQLLLDAAAAPRSYLIAGHLLTHSFQRMEIPCDQHAVRSLKQRPLAHPDTYRHWCAQQYSNQTVRELSSEDLIAMYRNEPVVLLDVREESERADSLSSDLWIPFGELMRRAEEIPKHQKVVLYCSVGYRSYMAVQRLQERFGFSNLYHLKGGLSSASEADRHALAAYRVADRIPAR
ncbi:MAG: HesA/MoeB/ThiF family protein [Chitinophagales bacterium]|nr:HesA/MoeB/ThiF family protein [Chitinophagales bacterium]MDW8393679.1 HesA/MoeB/ThiF family protein [Chitinophagales bacterium]